MEFQAGRQGIFENNKMKIKAISLHQPWASMIAQGFKTIETRHWPTDYRGDLLIVSTQSPEMPGFLCGYALCIVNVIDCRRMTVDDIRAARCRWNDRAWAWILTDLRKIEPFRVRGQQGLYEVEIEV